MYLILLLKILDVIIVVNIISKNLVLIRNMEKLDKNSCKNIFYLNSDRQKGGIFTDGALIGF